MNRGFKPLENITLIFGQAYKLTTCSF